MQLIQEVKKILIEKESIIPLDFFVASSIFNLFPDLQPEAKIWVAILHAQYREGAVFTDLLKIEKDEKYREIFSLLKSEDIASALSPIAQNFDQEITKPLIKIDGLYCFSKAYAESVGWLVELKNKLKEQIDCKLNENLLDENLSDEQKGAVLNFFSYQWLILTGGPGRGKTYTAKQIVKKFLEKYPDAIISCCAPTGKAAENLAKMIESVSSKALISSKTVHSLLKISPSNMQIDEFDEIEADLLIIDECSMIDFSLFSLLVKKIKPNTKVLLIGDPEQLPPVKGISPFSLLISLSSCIPNLSLSRLTIPLRTQQKGLIELTDGVLLQDVQMIKKAFADSSVEINPLESVFSFIGKSIESFVQMEKDEMDFQKLYDLKILTTHNIGPFGSELINKYCINLLEKKFQKKSYLIPIIFKENDEKFGIYNGELAYLSYFKEKPVIHLKNSRNLSPAIAPKYEFAFAISIHKSQGSEFSHVFLTLQNISEVTKALVYTAVSRAKKTLKIFGTIDQLIECQKDQNQCEDYCKNICAKIFEDSTLKHV